MSHQNFTTLNKESEKNNSRIASGRLSLMAEDEPAPRSPPTVTSLSNFLEFI